MEAQYISVLNWDTADLQKLKTIELVVFKILKNDKA
jgi:hypothetical protein